MASVIDLPACARQLLIRLFPTIDWDRVTFLEGLPFWVEAGTEGITIPDPTDAWRFRVYLGTHTDFCNPEHVALLLHEAVHVGQFMSFANGYGLGFFRPAFVGYFACHFAHNYANNPYEDEAEDYERRFRRCYQGNPVCDCTRGRPVFNQSALDALVKCDESLIVRAPRAPYCATLWWLLAVPLVGVIAILAFIVHWFDRVKCRLIEKQHSTCVNWATQAQETCQEWGWRTIEQCVEWAKQTTERCDKWVDEGSSKCSQWADQGSSKCCTWWPCSWGCKALVWVAKWVCVATVWVSNMVCKLLVLVTTMICALVALVSVLVCLLFTIVVLFVCTAWFVFWSFVRFCWI